MPIPSDREIAQALRAKADALEAETRAKTILWRKTADELDPPTGHPSDGASVPVDDRLIPQRRRDPSVMGRIVDVFNEHPERQYDATELLRALREAGWVPSASDPINSLRTSLGRLHDRGEIRRVRKGWYQAIERTAQSSFDNGSESSSVNGSQPHNDEHEERPFVVR
jgi:hypothetical protein